MKYTGVIAIIIYLLAMITSSCELDDNLDMDLPEGDPILLVEAYLVEGESLKILVYRSNTLQEPVRMNLIWNASVYIIEDNDSLKLKNIINMERATGYLYNYLLDTLVNGSKGEYNLYIEGEGFKPVSAVCRPVGAVHIENVSYQTSVLEVKSRNLDDPSENYYMLRLNSFSEGYLSEVNQIISDQHTLPEGDITISYPYVEGIQDSLRVDLYRIDSTAYDYQRSVSNALGANRDPFTVPSPFRGNLENAWGIFTCMSRDSYVLYPEE